MAIHTKEEVLPGSRGGGRDTAISSDWGLGTTSYLLSI